MVGYAGSGKSSMGKRLARMLGVRYVDTDRLIEESVGASVADIFYYEGEEYFRRSEREVIERLVDERFEGVVATGGGLAAWGDNMERMNEVGETIYLRRTPEQIMSRLSDYGREKRPMFRGKSDEELIVFMREQMAEREKYYAQADITVECTALSDDDVVERVVNELNNR